MGNQCLGGAGRPPSAVQLCTAFERNGHGAAASASSPSGAAIGADGAQSIWQFVAREEVQQLGEIVQAWTRGDVDGFTAKRQLQRVFRDELPPSPGRPTAQDGGRRAPHSGSGGGGSGAEPQFAWAPAPATAARGGGGAHHEEEVVQDSHTRDDRGPRPQPRQPNLFQDFDNAGGLFASFAAALGGGPRRANVARSHELFSTIDTIFGARFYEDAHSLAMRELGIDGSVPSPDEVRASFREKALGILQAAPCGARALAAAEQREAVSARLDLFKLCLCIDVLRNIRGSSSRRGARTSTPAPSPAGMFASRLPLQAFGPAVGGAGATMVSAGRLRPMPGGSGIAGAQTTSVDLVFIGGGGGMMVVGLSGFGDHAGDGRGGLAPFRLDEQLLQARINVLLQAILVADTGESVQNAGLTVEEIDRVCPMVARGPVSDDDAGCCPICLENSVAGEQVRKLPCGHLLHKECCEAWLTTADTCPTCRFQLPRIAPGAAAGITDANDGEDDTDEDEEGGHGSPYPRRVLPV